MSDSLKADRGVSCGGLAFRVDSMAHTAATGGTRTHHGRRGVRFALRTASVGLMIIGATASLILGLTMPVVELTHFYVWSETHSFISIVGSLYAERELFLASVLVIFSMLFPVIKLAYLLVAYANMAGGRGGCRNVLNRMSWLGKWSMLDVLVLALVIFYIKASALAEATTLPGIYFFSGAVLMTMMAYALVEHGPGRPAY
jgi:paraquat-inducible protein A